MSLRCYRFLDETPRSGTKRSSIAVQPVYEGSLNEGARLRRRPRSNRKSPLSRETRAFLFTDLYTCFQALLCFILDICEDERLYLFAISVWRTPSAHSCLISMISIALTYSSPESFYQRGSFPLFLFHGYFLVDLRTK